MIPNICGIIVIAGFFTGGALAIRGGAKAARNSAIGCACLLAVIEGVGIGFQRMIAENARLDVRPPISQHENVLLIFDPGTTTASTATTRNRRNRLPSCSWSPLIIETRNTILVLSINSAVHTLLIFIRAVQKGKDFLYSIWVNRGLFYCLHSWDGIRMDFTRCGLS
jgi:hypothetical protein